MKNKRFKSLYWKIVATALLVIPYISLASSHEVNVGGGGSGQSRINNPIKQDSILGLLKAALKVVLEIAIPVAALALVYSGFLFVKARGNPEELTKAKTTFLWAVIGTAVILGSWVLTQGLCETINSLGGDITCT